MNWQPISTAPKDGTAILTDCGIARQFIRWGIFRECNYDGVAYSCAQEGPYECKPRHWMPLPKRPALSLSVAVQVPETEK